MGQVYVEKILLPKGATIVEGSYQVQVGTDFIDGDGEFSQKLTAQQLLNRYGVVIEASDREKTLINGILEYTDFEVQVGQKPGGGYAFRILIP